MKKAGKWIIQCISNIFIVFLVICTVIVFYQKFILKSDILKIGDYYIFQIVSGSMEDSLSIGDCIIVKDDSNYDVGNIVTYQSGSSYVTHRVQEVYENSLVTKGDANNTNDNPILKEDVVGKFMFKSSILTIFFRYRYSFILVILTIFIISLFFTKEEKPKIIEEELEII